MYKLRTKVSTTIFAIILGCSVMASTTYAADDPELIKIEQKEIQQEIESSPVVIGTSEIFKKAVLKATLEKKEVVKDKKDTKKKGKKDKDNNKKKKTDKKKKEDKDTKKEDKKDNKKKHNKKAEDKKTKKNKNIKKVKKHNKKKNKITFTVNKVSPKKKFVKVSRYGHLNVRKGPTMKFAIANTLTANSKVKIVGKIKDKDVSFVLIKYKGKKGNVKTGFVSKNYLSNKKQKFPKITYHTTTTASTTTYNSWRGSKLNRSNGTVYGPSGRETYYNLNMSGVIRIMNKYGYDYDDYAVRSDGVKTLGGYVMVAANLSVHPRGSLVATSLGTGIVCDTGGFVHNGSGVSLDIATSW